LRPSSGCCCCYRRLHSSWIAQGSSSSRMDQNEIDTAAVDDDSDHLHGLLSTSNCPNSQLRQEYRDRFRLNARQTWLSLPAAGDDASMQSILHSCSYSWPYCCCCRCCSRSHSRGSPPSCLALDLCCSCSAHQQHSHSRSRSLAGAAAAAEPPERMRRPSCPRVVNRGGNAQTRSRNLDDKDDTAFIQKHSHRVDGHVQQSTLHIVAFQPRV
jgi:hypothetical protein